jgi:hypothetical protein
VNFVLKAQEVKNGFYNYIDDNSLFLCPLVFTNQQIFEIKFGIYDVFFDHWVCVKKKKLLKLLR